MNKLKTTDSYLSGSTGYILHNYIDTTSIITTGYCQANSGKLRKKIDKIDINELAQKVLRGEEI